MTAVLGPDWEHTGPSRLAARAVGHGAAEAARYFDRICDELIDVEVLAGSERPFHRRRGSIRAGATVSSCSRRTKPGGLLPPAGVGPPGAAGTAISPHAIGGRHPPPDGGRSIRMFPGSRWEFSSGLAGVHAATSAVIGDDDQAIHRFRGASVASMLEFSRRFPGCRTARSHHQLSVSPRHCGSPQAGGWTRPHQWEAGDRVFRYAKDIVALCAGCPRGLPGRHLGAGPGPRGRGRTARGPAQVPERQRRNHQFLPGCPAAPQRERQPSAAPYLDGLERAGIPARCEPAGHGPSTIDDEVLVTTIHQSKGREWSVVVVGSQCGPDMATDRIGRHLADCDVYSGEPEDLIGEFDRARQHYTAFTRARCLLVLTASGEPQARFRSIWEEASRWPGVDRDALGRQRFGIVEPAPRQTVDIDHLDRLVVRLAPPG